MTLGSARGRLVQGRWSPGPPGPLLYWVLVWALGRQEGVPDPAPPLTEQSPRRWREQGTVGNRAGGALTQERTEADLQEGKVRAMQVWGRGPG